MSIKKKFFLQDFLFHNQNNSIPTEAFIIF